jgi:NAD(P)-dependent dehydrogenase (short-subunit alcohol dehydrogenase family)
MAVLDRAKVDMFLAMCERRNAQPRDDAPRAASLDVPMSMCSMASGKLLRIPMRRFGEAQDFGGIAVYLASKASSYRTAECFVIDGGYSAF